jgi:signal peptidase I
MPENDQKHDFFDRVQLITESFLSYQKRKRRIKKEKRKGKNAAVDWIEAILWAVCMVLLINQYLVQAYRIPSGSMIDTLNIGDHVFVNKIIYGPELLPGILKIPSPVKPERNDIIIFENPTYISRGPVFDIAQRVIYMLTLARVDIDKDDQGEPRVHFLIKRAAGQAGDRIVFEDGEIKICFEGEDRYVTERDYIAARGWNHNLTRLLNDDHYQIIEATGRAFALADAGLPIPEKLMNRAGEAAGMSQFFDFVEREKVRLETLRMLAPHERRYALNYAKNILGWFIPHGRIFPLGDNRDSSRDGRYFGPVKISKVLGQGMIKYWPLTRMGKIL